MVLNASKPLIGLTTYLEQAQTGVWDVRASFLPKVYIDGVTNAGGVAVLLPPQPVSTEIAEGVVARLDGLIVTGGADVDPARYGQDPHERTDQPRLDRDSWEDALLRAAIELNVPFLGICRGAQVLNVALGGTLHQHLPDLIGSTKYQLGGGEFRSEPVHTETGSTLHTLVGDDVAAPVYHHQAINQLGTGLRVTARSADDVIEAIELDGVSFGVAVQWHPEQDLDDIRLFAGLVDAARTHRAQKSTS
ncbi:MAG: gamma-glutamyl-gamma-aminobutyrate hydrolase family protein [Microbacteriaceae bacterium]